MSWTPRWYYIMENRTSGMKYIGQTIRPEFPKNKYCGSGRYWKEHCQKHGGHDIYNIDILSKFWFDHRCDAEAWLVGCEELFGEYWDEDEFANRVPESTEDNVWAGESGKMIQKKRVAEGTHPFAGEAGSRLATELNLKRVSEGTNPWCTDEYKKKMKIVAKKNSEARIREGSHPWAGKLGSDLQKKRVAEGTHPLAGEAGRKLNLKRVAEGVHPFAGEAGSELQKKRIAEGTHNWAGEVGSRRATELNLKRAAEGTNPWSGLNHWKAKARRLRQRISTLSSHPMSTSHKALGISHKEFQQLLIDQLLSLNPQEQDFISAVMAGKEHKNG